MSEHGKGRLRQLFLEVLDNYEGAEGMLISETLWGDAVEDSYNRLKVECQEFRTKFEALLAAA